MVGMVVRDMGATLRFYRLLGLEIPKNVDDEPFVKVITPNGYRLSWNAESMMKEIDPEWERPSGGYRIGLAFRSESPMKADEVYQKLVSAGHANRKEPWDAFWGQRYAVVEDPDGNPTDLFCPLGG